MIRPKTTNISGMNKRPHCQVICRLCFELVGLVCFVLIALGASKRDAEDTPGIERFPKSLSQLDGFEGIVVKRGWPCPRCCQVVFPDGFGRASSPPHQHELLRAMAFDASASIKLDLDCPRLWYYDALDQLFYLANTFHEVWAAKTLLEPSGPGVDGELAEEYEDMYLIPTLLGLDTPLKNLGLQREKLIIRSICGWMRVHNDKRRLMRVVRHLRQISMTKLATGLENCGDPPLQKDGKGH